MYFNSAIHYKTAWSPTAAAVATAGACGSDAGAQSTGLRQHSDTSVDDPWLDDSETRS